MHDTTGFRLSADAIDTAALHARLDEPAAGACVVFEGRVRNHHAGRAVLGLAYEAYADLAEAEGRRIVDAIRERHGLHRALCVHRVGTLDIGEVAVWVGVSAAHRDAAFEGCRAIIDAIKQDVPIWKRERYADGGAAWLHPEEGRGGR
ncbi:molybdenum cofactor biosynthesis protein MoaE [Luteimonas yindakuii]|uniref:Molybdopterin synthase catalytic subunit n=1 Tax=Luteimonas yindakuii TaxID=2565782 RepID=A0A4Z1R466_9GAMM|nr:molybdenum cofactor biosynthesis protein MoaE [Luteimonas yindakuii]QCO68085.1 molybdenum cofactor biosynthesis protein MoaE [Luteimonas yindakuii]TKS54444.1 molybdenum cofactor biosynthesis protein MoaE [Luteimonas yindakuii]